LQRVVFTLTDDPFRTSLPAFENNELDVTDQIQPGDIDRVRKDAKIGSQLQKYRWSGTAAIFCDTTNTKSPLSKVKVRQALYLALDHKRIATEVLRGIYDPATTITPPGTIGYLERWGSDYEGPANWANILFDSEQHFFHTRWRSDRFDSLVRKGAGEGNAASRKQMYESAEGILNTELPAIPVYHLGVIVAV